MDNPQHKQKFQVERIAFFSDAVFAIAITLMIIEVKPPHFHKEMSGNEMMEAFLEKVPLFFGVILSFVFIGGYWQRHHHLFKYITAYNGKMLALNMAMLCSVIFLPFSTAFMSENITIPMALPIIFYNINYIVASLLTYWLFSYCLNSANNLSTELTENREELFREILFPVFVFSLVIVLALFNPIIAPVGYSMFGFQGLFVRKGKRKATPAG